MIDVIIKGDSRSIEENLSVTDLLTHDGYKNQGMVAVQINEVIIDRDDYDKTIIEEKDDVEIMYFQGGGQGEQMKKANKAGKKKLSEYSCELCGTRTDVTFDPCPYNEEIHGNDTKVWMCGNCRHESAQDI